MGHGDGGQRGVCGWAAHRGPAHHAGDLRGDAGPDQPDEELHRRLRDVQDHVIRITEQVDAFRTLLHNALTVQAILVGQQQNEEMQRLSEASLGQNDEVKRISAWAAIIFAPSLVGTVYGMYFEHMPELDWPAGYPFALALMLVLVLVLTLGLYLAFKWKKWL